MNPVPYLPAEIAAPFDWTSLLTDGTRGALVETILPEYLPSRRWFGGKARGRRGFVVVESFSLSAEAAAARLLFVRVEYLEGPPETYALPLQTAVGERARRLVEATSHAIVARFRGGVEETLLFDATYDEGFRADLLRMIAGQRVVAGRVGELCGGVGRGLSGAGERLDSRVLEVEQSNSSIVYGAEYFLKLYRRVEEGVNPDAELTRFLSERRHFPQVPRYAGAIEFRRPGVEASVLALLVGLVPKAGDGWAGTLAGLREFCATVGEKPVSSEAVRGLLRGEFERARLLGQRTAEMHLALAGDTDDPAFAPESFTERDWRELHASMCGAVRQGLAALQQQLPELPEKVRAASATLVAREQEIIARHARLLESPMRAMKTRIHGDYHLGQVLETGGDFVILDFEGEPARPLAERRLKASPLRDVAGMLRSFDYAARTVLNAAPVGDQPALKPWLRTWERLVRRAFLDAWFATADGAAFLPDRAGDRIVLLESFLLDKAIYEIGYELNNRPDWLPIPVGAVLALLDRPPAGDIRLAKLPPIAS